MKNTFLKKLAIGAAIICSPVITMAWGALGHRISGQIAFDHLNPKARAAVQGILGNESLALASNWADFVRSDSTYAATTPWHFIDIDRVYTYPELVEYLQHDTQVDVYTKLEMCINELKKKDLTKTNKLFYLHMLIHLAEDIHQPLHTTGHEQGGNGVKLNWFGKSTNLHTVWDSEIINNQQLSYTEYAAALDHATASQIKDWQSAPVTKWIFESNVLAEKIYNEAKPGQNLSYKYDFDHRATINEQLLKGGIRLAGLLNELFG